MLYSTNGFLLALLYGNLWYFSWGINQLLRCYMKNNSSLSTAERHLSIGRDGIVPCQAAWSRRGGQSPFLSISRQGSMDGLKQQNSQSEKGAQVIADSAGAARGVFPVTGTVTSLSRVQTYQAQQWMLKVAVIQNRNLIRTDVTEEMVHRELLWPICGDGCCYDNNA